MLRTLRIRNLVIIDDLAVEFGPGLNVITGETGAGKSIVVDAVGLAVGQRADRSQVRSGESKAVIEALFELSPSSDVLAALREAGRADDDDCQVLVRREIPTEGGQRITINGAPATLSMLRELATGLLELHGQHEQQSLLSADRQLELLDRFGGHGRTLAKVAETREAVRQARSAIEELDALDAERDERRQRLSETIGDIDAVEPKPGELDELERERVLLQNASRVAELLETIVTDTFDSERSAASIASAAARRAQELAELDPSLAEPAARLASAAIDLQEAGSAFRDYREMRSSFDPGRLEDLEARRAAIERLCLRYGQTEAEVLAARDRARDELARIDGFDESRNAAREACARHEAAYVRAALVLGRERRKAAKRIVPAVQDELGALALERATLDVAFSPAVGPAVERPGEEPLPLGRRGAERAELLLAANPGEPPRPLSKVASGGELSRIMLALHTVFEAAGEGRALVFDEVDAGIGGPTADAVGARLAGLGQRHQVLCVTHQPQVAAHAERHLVVAKAVTSGRTHARIRELSRDERVEELARMLGGQQATAASRKHASELLASPKRRRPRGGEVRA